MPIDPTIALAVRPPQLQSPLEIAQHVTSLRNLQSQGQALDLGNQERMRQMADEQKLSDAYMSAYSPDDTGVMKLDRDKVTRGLASRGAGHLVPGLMKQWTDLDEKGAQLAETRGKAALQEAEYVGSIGALGKLHPDMFPAALARAADPKGLNYQSAAEALATLNADPSRSNDLADGLIAASQKQRELANATRTATARELTAVTGQTRLTLEQAEKRQKDAATALGRAGITAEEYAQAWNELPAGVAKQFDPPEAFDPKTTPAKARALGMTPAEQSTDERGRQTGERGQLSESRLGEQFAETQRHNRAMEARPVAGAVGKTFPGNFDLVGDAFLESIPKPWQRTVAKIADYEEDPTKVASMRGGMREMLTAWVNQVNPAYDAGLFTNRAPTRKAFTTGTQGQQINAINTAIGHIDQLTTLAQRLENGGFVPGNAAWNTLRTMFGSDKVTNFDTLKDALAGEVASVLSKGAATVSGIAAEKDKIKGASSPTQLAGYVKTLVPVMGSKLASLDYQYHQAMGENDPFSALSPESKRILVKHGFDPAHPTIEGGSAGPTQGPTSVTVTSPNGKSYTLKDQATADAFVEDAKAKGLWK